jgi:hypothetical protein
MESVTSNRKANTMRYALLLILLLTAVSAAASADRSGGGFAVHLGMGSLYGAGDGGGAAVEYQVLLRPGMRLSPFVAGGQVGSNQADAPSHEFGYCIGVNAEYGKFQRIFAGPSFGTQFLEWDHDTTSNVQAVIGPSFVLGYKGTAHFGLLWQVYLGAAYIINYKYSEHKDNPVPVFGLGIGYKF